ncbi:MAG: ATP-binding cassette domain-containing protein [Rhizobacter sp.]|nr:ATP-binding cassette domain-containing protein [Chlorobiales bacterium]
MARYSRTDTHKARMSDDDKLPKAKINSETLGEAAKLFSYLLPYRAKFSGALVALFISSLLGLAFPYITGNLVDGAMSGRATTGSPAKGFSIPSVQGFQMDIDTLALALIGILILQAFFSFFQSLWFSEVGERSLADLRKDTYSRLIILPMTFFAQRRVGELSSRISADLSQIQDTLIGVIPQVLRQFTILVGGVVLITMTSGKLTLVMISTFPMLIVVAILFGKKIRKISRDAQDSLADSGTIVEETLQGITNVKAFANEGYEINRYTSSITAFITIVLKGAKYRAAFVSFIFSALLGAVVLVMWYGSKLVQAGELTVGELTRFILYTTFVGGAMATFAELYSQIQKTLGATQRVRELLKEVPEQVEISPLPVLSMPTRVRGDVAFENVEFSYPSRKELQVLKGVSLAAKAGERIALVGPSGAGKSTLVSMLLRFYEPDGGRLVIDGKDAKTYPLTALRNQMSIVPQDVMLFGGSIGENISYGKPGAGESEIIEAAKKANAHEFIMSFPEGYQTLVGERGIKLSGGQRQRVAIARAILKDPAILILDEATSSLDSESERLVQEALEVLMQGRTSFIIAHRLATVRTADRIAVIKEGIVAESGTHEELIEKENGVYRTLSELQFDLS